MPYCSDWSVLNLFSIKKKSYITYRKTKHYGKVIVIAAGLGCFEPRKPEIKELSVFEDLGVDYIIKDPYKYDKKK